MFEKHSAFINILTWRAILVCLQIVRESGWRTYIGVPIQDTRGQLVGDFEHFWRNRRPTDR